MDVVPLAEFSNDVLARLISVNYLKVGFLELDFQSSILQKTVRTAYYLSFKFIVSNNIRCNLNKGLSISWMY